MCKINEIIEFTVYAADLDWTHEHACEQHRASCFYRLSGPYNNVVSFNFMNMPFAKFILCSLVTKVTYNSSGT